MEKRYKVLFVCLGNICRSPAADGIMHHLVAEQGLSSLIEIDSCGTYGGHRGELPDSRMRQAGAKRGYNFNHPSRQICEDDYYDFDLIVVMDDMNYEKVCHRAPERKYADKVVRMASYCRHHTDRTYIPDPYYEGREGFELVLNMLEDGCQELLEVIKNKINSGS